MRGQQRLHRALVLGNLGREGAHGAGQDAGGPNQDECNGDDDEQNRQGPRYAEALEKLHARQGENGQEDREQDGQQDIPGRLQPGHDDDQGRSGDQRSETCTAELHHRLVLCHRASVARPYRTGC